MPPALVERLPPIWQLPSAASESGNRRPTSSAACCTLASTQPASTVMVSFRRSMLRMRFMRPSASTISRRLPVGTEPPDRPVLPPWGTIATSCSAASATTRATCAVLAGRTLTEADNTWFSLLTMNQHPLHIDAVYGAGTEFGRPLVNSALTLAIVTGMSVSDVSQKTVANLGWDKVRLTAPVFAGDTIYA